jgi:acyl dehydratase
MAETRIVRSIDELAGLVGQEMGVGPWFEVTQQRVNDFADVTGDHQWIHVDIERANSSPLGGPIAHGFLTLSLLPELRRNMSGVQLELGQKMGINYGLNRVRFITPVRVGRRIRARSKLLEVEKVADDIYHLLYQQTIEIEGEQRPAMVAETISRVVL